jgi:hypothetical protein
VSFVASFEPYAAVPAFVDRNTFAGASLIGLVPLLLALLVVAVKWWRGRDEVFDGVTPGLLPGPRDSGSRSRVRGGEWAGPVAVQFHAPDGVSPGVAGTVIDGVAHAHDVSAVIVDLAVRGWFRIEEVGGGAESGERGAGAVDAKRAKGTKGKRDWVLHRSAGDPADTLTAFERKLLDSLFANGPDVQLSGLKGGFAMTMREAQIGLYRDVVDRGWYRRHPRARNSKARFWGLMVMVPLALLALALVGAAVAGAHDWSLAPLAVGALLTIVVLAKWGGSRTPRTAEGSAARIQALGFREYLATAEADQLKFEELQTIVTRYLPWAVAFGLTAHWARLFAGLSHDPRWPDVIDGLDVADSFFWYSPGGDGVDLDAIGDGLGDLADGVGEGLGALGEGLGDLGAGVADAISGFTDATDSLFSFDGLSGCADGCGDGCDLPGCDF